MTTKPQMKLLTSLYARIFGSDLTIDKIVDGNTKFTMADPEFVGVMPVRQDIQCLPPDEPRRLSIGWTVNEIIGVGIVNPPRTEWQKLLDCARNMLQLRLIERDGGWAYASTVQTAAAI